MFFILILCWLIWLSDDGGGMNPDRMRQCMSLGYSVKSKSANTIGQCTHHFLISSDHFSPLQPLEQHLFLLHRVSIDYSVFVFPVPRSYFSCCPAILYLDRWFNFSKVCLPNVADGNGFKTSTMRLGADVIVFSRSRASNGHRYCKPSSAQLHKTSNV